MSDKPIHFFESYAIQTIETTETCIEFVVAKVIGHAVDGAEELPLYSTEACGTTGQFDEAEKSLSGSIKWDGCSNWDFHTEACAAHFCGRKDAVGIGRLMGHLYDLAAGNLLLWDAELAE